MLKKVLFLAIAAGITIIATFIQQIISSDSPNSHYITINNKEYLIKLPVVHEGDDECLLELNIPDSTITGTIHYKLLRGNDEWKEGRFIRMNENLVSILPFQKPNIKIQYFIELTSRGKSFDIGKKAPMVIRFQSIVPKFILFPQVVLMFLALIVACFAGLLTIFNIDSYKKYANLSFYLFVAGAIVLGFLIHIISFRHILVMISPYNDLTFYKNLLIALIWIGTYYFNKKYNWQYITLAAAVITLVLYCMPQHILFGWIQY